MAECTSKGELCLIVSRTVLLSPCLHSILQKHELKSEGQYRQRYLDLIMNDGVSKKFNMRAKIISFIRRFLEEKGIIKSTNNSNTIYY